jgi:hypothetical protein
VGMMQVGRGFFTFFFQVAGVHGRLVWWVGGRVGGRAGGWAAMSAASLPPPHARQPSLLGFLLACPLRAPAPPLPAV